MSLQNADGHWCGELQGDSILESEYILMKFIVGQERAPMRDGRDGWETLTKIANYLRRLQRPDGGWGQFPGSGIDISATVKAYFALKLMGDDSQSPQMLKAREVIRSSASASGGGAEQCNSFTNFYLACLGQISWNAVPAIPPELVYLPRWFYFHMTKVSAWTRTMILPLSLVVTLRPMRELPRDSGIDELFVDQDARHRMKNKSSPPKGWSTFFLAVDRVLKFLHSLGGSPIRGRAIRKAEQWILDRAGQDGIKTTAGLGAIFPPMVYLQIAFMALGYRRDHAVIRRAEQELDEFFIEDHERNEIRIQPCFSPVWDTGIALYALTDCGLDSRQGDVARACDWLRGKECRHVGDWLNNVSAQAQRKDWKKGCGWYFEYHNAWYPDVDDTAMVAMALNRAGGQANTEAAKRGVDWLLAMQNDDGGWAAFDKTTHRQILEYIPFADHNAMQDPSCPDITGRVLECLSWHGYRLNHPAVRRAVEYIRSRQVLIDDLRLTIDDSPRTTSRDRQFSARQNAGLNRQSTGGCFFGRWGVNYIYGTWQAVIGPIRCGVPKSDEWIQRTDRWIKSIQKDDGSFGENANSYEDPSLKGQGPSTASQTAWAAMILQEIHGANDPDLKRAIDWLAASQLSEADAPDPTKNPDGDPPGCWVEPWFTGTGFPKVFYLRYHLYRMYFPLMAIGRYLAAHGANVGHAVEIKAEHAVAPPAHAGI